MTMGMFKKLAVLYLIVLVIVAPIGLLFLPSWNSKLTPMLNLVDTLLGEGAEDKILLGGFAFVESDESTLTLRLDLGINNTDGPTMMFPAVNLTFKYGNSPLGVGWISEAVTIPADSVDATIPIYAKMYKGDAFNQFMLSLISGGLSLSVSSGEAFVFLETFGGIPAGQLSIPLPSIPLPAIDFGDIAYLPSCHGLSRGPVADGQPVVVSTNVSDRGGGVGEVILSWSANGGAWQNTTMTELPLKDLFGGRGTLLGDALNDAFPNYPNSTIPTSWAPATVSANISPYSAGTEVKYRIYVVDVYNHTTIVPSEDPLNETGADPDPYNTTELWFGYNVTGVPLATYVASWEEYGKMKTTQNGEDDMMSDLFASLTESGIDLFGALIASSSTFSAMMEMELTIENLLNISTLLLDMLQPLIEYMHTKGVNPFELIDQLLGLSGGIPGVDPVVRDNVNESIGLDMLMESGLGLASLIQYFDVNLSVFIDELGNSIKPPIAGGDTLGEALFNLLDATRASPAENASFFAFLDAQDVHYIDLSGIHVIRTDSSDTSLADFTSEAGDATANDVDLTCDIGDRFYFGSPMVPPLIPPGPDVPVSNFSAIRFEMGSTGNDPVEGIQFAWEYYNGIGWSALPILTDETANLNNSGRIVFALPADHQPFDLSGVLGFPNHWIRMRITDNATAGFEPKASRAWYAEDFVPYYFEHVNVDLFGRQLMEVIPGETDSFANLLAAMNGSNGYALLIWQLLDEQNVDFDAFLAEVDGEYQTVPAPVTGADILAASTPIMALFVYGILLLGMLAALRGRKGTYAIPQSRVKKWYGSMTVTPSLKTREEVEKYKWK